MKKHLQAVGSKCMLLLSTVIFSQLTFGQVGILNKAELGVTIAPSNFLGDLGGNYGKGTAFLKDNNFSQTRMFYGVHFSSYPMDWLGVRLALNYGTVSGDDATIKGKGGYEEARKVRNLSFKSSIVETFLAAEIYPTVFLEMDPSDLYHKIRPYAVGGVGLFHFNPKSKDPATGNYVSLKGLSTEGQGFPEYADRKEYSLTQVMLPLGAGIKYFINDNVSLSLEVIMRKTFTDYIDDVSNTYIDPALFDKNFGVGSYQSQLAYRMADKRATNLGNSRGGDKRGTPTNNDSYYTAGFKLSFTLGNSNPYSNSMRCPTIRY
jgi:opacity protein-like surface antigen